MADPQLLITGRYFGGEGLRGAMPVMQQLVHEARDEIHVLAYVMTRQALPLLDAIEAALARDRTRRESENALNSLKTRFSTLSSREREIMFQATAGRLNKQIAGDMGIAISTVKVHRTNLMRKMKARSLPELSRMADALKSALQKS